MIQTTTFFLLSAGSTLLTLLLIATLPAARGAPLARGVLLLIGGLSIAAFLVTALRSAQLLPPGAIPPLLFQILLFRAWIPIGVGLVALLGLLATHRSPTMIASTRAASPFLASPAIPQALRISVALSFLGVELGKVTHDADMRRFFADSGLPIWMNYAVILAELAGALGLFTRPLRVPAAAGLSFLMVGAIATHVRNGDPFTDSLEAVQLVVLLACLLTLWTWPQQRSVIRAA